jgi:transcriptional regulator with GAF, ATPase, and Fis domain
LANSASYVRHTAGHTKGVKAWGAQTSWTAEASAVNRTASFEVEETQSAKVTLHNEEFCGRGMSKIIGTSAALQSVLGMVRMVAPNVPAFLVKAALHTGSVMS